MAMTADVVEFTRDDIGPLVTLMSTLAERGEGWINIGPGLTPEEFASLPPRSAVSKWLSGRGPAVPMATWTPATVKGRATSCQVGIAHGTGPNALERLEKDGISLPSGWRKRQDHAKNGIVAEVPDEESHRAVVEWLIRAMIALSPQIEVGDDWVAEAYGAD